MDGCLTSLAMGFSRPPTSLQMLHHHQPSKADQRPLPPRSVAIRPVSQATEIIDSDDENDGFGDEYASRNSLESLSNGSSTTTGSSRADAATPPGSLHNLSSSLASSASISPAKPVEGPTGPHLFRGSFDSGAGAPAGFGRLDDYELDLSLSPVAKSAPTVNWPVLSSSMPGASDPSASFAAAAATTSANTTTGSISSASSTTPPPAVRRASTTSSITPEVVQAWSPTKVAEWMYDCGVDDGIVNTFIINHISGAVLLDLTADDLRELGVQSFGKRHRILSMVQNLGAGAGVGGTGRSNAMADSPRTRSQSLSTIPNPSRSNRSSPLNAPARAPAPVIFFPDHFTAAPATVSPPRRRRPSSSNDPSSPTADVSPADVSIVAVEQLLPEPHVCAKGDACKKTRRRRLALERLAAEFPNEFVRVGGERAPVLDWVKGSKTPNGANGGNGGKGGGELGLENASSRQHAQDEEEEDEQWDWQRGLPVGTGPMAVSGLWSRRSELAPSVMPEPSVVASSDVLGPLETGRPELDGRGCVPDAGDDAATNIDGADDDDDDQDGHGHGFALNPRDNVRQFLGYQHFYSPTFPPPAFLQQRQPSSPHQSPLNSPAQLKCLPKLTIPGRPAPSVPMHQQYTLPPASHMPFSDLDIIHIHGEPLPRQASQSAPPHMLFRNGNGSNSGINDDAAKTPVPAPRLVQTPEPIMRPITARPEIAARTDRPDTAAIQRRRPSFPTMATLRENDQPLPHLRPIENPQDLTAAAAQRAANHVSARTGNNNNNNNNNNSSSSSDTLASTTNIIPGAPAGPAASSSSSSCRSSNSNVQPSDITRAGWMKKRKTTRLLRHEWQDAHFTLHGTLLDMHRDEAAARRRSRALETIDVDDFAVACSSLAGGAGTGTSRLAAAFRRPLFSLKSGGSNNNNNNNNSLDDAAFAFSLIPADDAGHGGDGGSGGKSGSGVSGGGKGGLLRGRDAKSHHFAVRRRDERVNWMRELMLAKALKRGKEGGGEVMVNGNVI